MKVIVGLGNPELKYEMTKHNAGFLVIEKLCREAQVQLKPESRLRGRIVKVNNEGQSLLLVQPTTYMNLSGQCVQAVLNWYKVPLEELLIVHDDVSLSLGKVRLQSGGGAGGQHGIESVIETLAGLRQFDRLKFGVGPDPGGARRADYVLSPFPSHLADLYATMVSVAAQAVLHWAKFGMRETMSKFNGMDWQPQTNSVQKESGKETSPESLS